MKRYNTWLVMFALFLIVLLVFPGMVHAQDPSGLDPASDIDAPIDGGLGFLIAAGVGYGIKKYRDLKKKETSEQQIN